MNTIAFRIVPSEHAPECGEVQVLIDDVDLRRLVRVVESTQPDAGEIAGNYAGLRADQDVLPPSEHFLGIPRSPFYQYEGKTQVLGCSCGDPGCWPLVCTIEAGPAEVIWHDFEQPHRSHRHELAVIWSYGELGPFRFHRGEYEAALGSLLQPGH